MDVSVNDNYANKGVTADDVKKREEAQKASDAAAAQPKDTSTGGPSTGNTSTNK